MGNERNRMPSHVSEVPGCLGGLIGDLVRVGGPIVGIGLIALWGAGMIDRAGINSGDDLIPNSYGDEGKLIATPVNAPEVFTTQVEPITTESIQLTNECGRGGELRGKYVRVIDEDGSVIEGAVAGANNHWSVRDREGENKFKTAFCDEIQGGITILE